MKRNSLKTAIILGVLLGITILGIYEYVEIRKSQINEIKELDEWEQVELVDKYIEALMTSKDYLDSDYEQKVQKIKSALYKLAEKGTDEYPRKLIKKNSILLTGANKDKMFTFQYANGVLGGIQIVDNKLEYKIIDPIFIMDITSSRFKERGIYYDTLNQPNALSIYTISLGTQPSGGHSIKISEVNIDENDSVEILVEESHPKEGESTTSALSIPICQVNFNHNPKSIIVKNQDGEIYSSINY